MSAAPVGVFDSGLGGLSVAREIRARLPAEHILYLADSANCPYGGRPLEEIRALSVAAVGELVERGAKAVVVACNTASGAALETLRATFPVPIVGLEPAVKPAAALTRSGTIGVLATAATLKTERFERLTRRFASGVRVITQPAPGLVEHVEAGETRGAAVRATLDPLLAPFREAGADAVVLGCTHYPFLREVISEMLGPGVRIVDSGRAVARQLERVLRERGALAGAGHGGITVLTTGEAAEVAAVVERLWGEELPVRSVGAAYERGQLRSTGAPVPGGSSR